MISEGTFLFNSKLDSEFLGCVYEEDMDHAEMVFQKFVDTIEEQLTEIEEAFTSRDVENFRKKLHKLKPVLSYVGLTGLTTKAELIERSCVNVSDINVFNGAYTGFKTDLNEMKLIVEHDLTRLKQLKSPL